MTADELRAEAEKAMAALARAVASGFRDVEQIRKDPDLESLRKRDDFKKLMAKLASGKEAAKKP
jgi:hypothetical protein